MVNLAYKLDLKDCLITSDPEYFSVENLYADLTAFAQDANVSLEDLTTRKFNKVFCASGEELYIDSYVNRASKALYGLKSLETNKYRSRILAKLKRHIGLDIPDDMSICYFTQPTIHEDIKRFARKCGKVIGQLSQANACVSVECSNGETTTFGAYCRRIGNEWGYKDKKEIVRDVQEVAGMEFDKITPEYLNQENVQADFKAFAKANNVPIAKLNPSHNKEALCKNRLNMKFETYVLWAGKAWGYGDSIDEVKPQQIDVRNRLFNLIGIETEERIKYPEMEREYFNQANVYADLKAIAKATGCKVEDLNVGCALTRFVACNGEEIGASCYFNRAGKKFGLYGEGQIVENKNIEIIKFLKMIAGIKVDLFKPMDADYFNNPETIKSDLKSFAIKAGVPLSKLNTKHMSKNSAICANGKKMGGSTYLNKAGVAFGIIEDQEHRDSFRGIILNKLKQKANGA